MDSLNFFKRFGINIFTNLLPSPVASIIQTIDDCDSAEELAKQFDNLKREMKDYYNTPWLPSIPFSIETKYASVAIIYLLHEISDEQAKNIESYLNNNEVIEYWNEISCDNKTISIQVAEPIENSIMRDDFTNPLIKILEEEFDVKAKTVLYA